MSAWKLGDTHIDVLVNAAVQHGIIAADRATELGRHLIHENDRSLHARYGDPVSPSPNDVAYQCTPIDQHLFEPLVVVAIDCWMYQTCEYGQCRDQFGWQQMEALRNTLLSIPGVAEAADHGPHMQAWPVTDITEIVAPPTVQP